VVAVMCSFTYQTNYTALHQRRSTLNLGQIRLWS